jgi:hypothetical protein
MTPPSLHRTLPTWVEADPLRSRALDALGLQTTADRIADQLLPGLSVLTSRPRYYALLAWARRACGRYVDEHRIHRMEVALAIREAMLHRESDSGDPRRCRFVGSRNLAGGTFRTPPTDPKDAYRVPVWRAYRASMRSLDLLATNDELTDDGVALARRFADACRPKDASGATMLPASACLSAMGSREGELIEAMLGVRKKGRLRADDTSPRATRAALARELRGRGLFDAGISVSEVLGTYENSRGRYLSRTVIALREAAVWERLSVGLNAIFLLWLQNIRKPAIVTTMIGAARRAKEQKRLPFRDVPIGSDTAKYAVASIRRALTMCDRVAALADFRRSDPEAFHLGELVVSAAPRVEDIYPSIERRHLDAKGDDGWLRDGARGKELARDAGDKWKLPDVARLHSYRLGAFGQMLADLSRARGMRR